MTLDEALARLARVVPDPGVENVPLADLVGRRIREPVTLAMPLPPFTHSAMDGYAVRSADTPATLRAVGESAAGHPGRGGVGPGECWHVSTGAVLPSGADAVVRLERAVVRADRVAVPATAAGTDVRHAGEDGAPGAEVLPAGAVVGPHTVGAVAAAGRASALCARRVRVAVLLTGDEVVPPGAPLAPGQVPDVHRHALPAQVRAAGGDVCAMRHARDTAAAVRDALDALLADDPHVVVSAGGISVGRHDHVWAGLGARGFAEVFRGVGIRPGHPTALARRADGRLALALPGNPGAALVAFHLFARPLLGCIDDWDESLPLAAPWPMREDAVQIVRGAVRDGRVTPLGRRVTADGPSAWAPRAVLVRVPTGTGTLPEGAPVPVSRLG